MMSMKNAFTFRLLFLATLVIAISLALSAGSFAKADGGEQQEYARLIGGSGYGFCKFERQGRHVMIRLWVTGLQSNSIGTAWIIFDGKVVGRLGGTVATVGGDAEIRGEINVPPGTEVTIDARDHEISVVTIGNAENDPAADESLLTELTTPASAKLGTCTEAF